MPDPNAVVLVSTGSSWDLAYWSRSNGWRADDASRRPLFPLHWAPVASPWRTVRYLKASRANCLTLVLAGGRPYIAYRGDGRAPLSEWTRRQSVGMIDEPLAGVTHWATLPREPNDPRGGRY
jgi:hypothetical protein